ncbi:MAG: T9SS type A sorting domain-containing protein [Ignavibacteria bacterium]|nr:T9SS type A sorting domain-containing protein [Ignavibacteria bacterium]
MNYFSVYKTTNTGQNWNNFSFNGRTLTAMDFYNESTGWVGAYRGINNVRYSTVIKTTNGGGNWDSVSLQPASSIDNIKFYNAQTGWLTGIYQNKSYISRSTDGGAVWNLQFTANNNKILKLIYILDENHLWIAADNENLLRTTNGGANWQLLSFGFPNSRSVTALQFIDLNTGWAIVNYPSAQIIKTNNGGDTWTSQFDAGIDHLSSLYFANNMTGWATGSDGIIIKTTNGGEIFTGVNNPSAGLVINFSLSQNYPNPFNPVTNIKFDIPKSGFVNITIFDLLGREISTLVNEQMQPGSYTVNWDASNHPSGVYFYKLEVRQAGSSTGDFVESRKMVLVK